MWTQNKVIRILEAHASFLMELANKPKFVFLHLIALLKSLKSSKLT